MIEHIALGIVSVACLGLCLWVYITIITKKLATAALAVDKQAVVASSSGFFGKANAYLMHWKTIVLAWVAVIAQAFGYVSAETLQAWSGLPWSQVIDAKIATWITIICALLIPVTHASGVATAAKITPANAPDDGA